MGRFKHSAGTVWVLGLKDARDAEATQTQGSLQPRGKLWFLESADPGAATLAQSHPISSRTIRNRRFPRRRLPSPR